MFLYQRFGRSQKTRTEPDQFIYSPLDTSVDGLRLVTIEPAKDIKANIVCTLQNVTFPEKPRYEALSYTWGVGSDTKWITINRKKFGVGHNLFAALQHIRRTDRGRVMWIDAICINQCNVSEKSQQIRMMPFTYSRALQVIVWLGIFVNSPDPAELVRFFQAPTKHPRGVLPSPRVQSTLFALSRREYWQRVWIIQEIGLARKIIICFGSFHVAWEYFVAALGSYEKCHNSLPLRFQSQLDNKYSTGHKLQTLIEAHQNSLCKEPRDHIYGLVGLAIDGGDRFPIDYSKTLFEVWKDTIMFKAADQDSLQHDIMRFGKAVQTLLGGPKIATLDDIQSEILLYTEALNKICNEEYRFVQSKNSQDIGFLRIPTRIIGQISHIGPTHQQMISETRKIAQWKASIYEYIPENQLPSVREESDLFMEVLENVSEQSLKAIASYNRTIAWEPTSTQEEAILQHGRWSQYETINTKANLTLQPEARLFLLSQTSEFGDCSSSKLGLAPPEAQEGDYICQIQGITKALIVRRALIDRKRVVFRIVGTAVMAENKSLARVRRKNIAHLSRFGIARFDTIGWHEKLDVFIDIGTAFDLLS